MRRAAWMSTIALAGLSTNAFGFGMSTHAYIAWRVCGTTWPEVLYGSTAPDFFGMAPSPEIKNAIQSMTHFEFDRLAPAPFSMGFATHNGAWGADHYAHCYYDPGAPDTYFTARMRQLEDEFGISIYRGEDVIEAVLDYLIRRDFGPWWGDVMARAAESFTSTHAQLLVDAFAWPLSQRVPGLTLEQAQSTIHAMASNYRTLIRVYGMQLAMQDLPAIRSILVQGMAAILETDEITADAIMARAEVLCGDYRAELDAVAASVRDELKTTAYPMPACDAWPLSAAIAAVACLIFRKRSLNV